MSGTCDECFHRKDRLIPVAHTSLGGFVWVCPKCWRDLDYPTFHFQWNRDRTYQEVPIRLRHEPHVLSSAVK
jgi:hypothetical protein